MTFVSLRSVPIAFVLSIVASVQTADRRLVKTELVRPDGVDLVGSVSPDGHSIAFLSTANRHENIALWDVRAGTTRVLTAFPDLRDAEDGMAWSPDGRRLAVSCQWDPDRHRDIRVVDVKTGADSRVVSLDAAIQWVALLAWSPNGRFLAAGLGRAAGEGTIGPAQLVLISIADGKIITLKNLDGNLPHAAAFPRDGAFLAYDFAPRRGDPSRDVYVVSLDGRRDSAIAADPDASETLLGWRPSGELLYATERDGVSDVQAVMVSAGQRRGSSTAVARDVERLTPLGMARDGGLFAEQAVTVRDVFIVNVDPASGKAIGSPVSLAEPAPGTNRKEPAWSPDGGRLAFVEYGAGLAETVVVQTVATGVRHAYPVPVRNLDHPLWTPDGRAFLFDGTGPDDQQRMFKLELDTGSTTAVTDCVCFVHAISPDGRFEFRGGPDGLVRRDTTDGSSIVISPPEEAAGNGTLGSSKLSPDGRWFAFFTHRMQPGGLAIRSSTGGPMRVLVDPFNFGYSRLAWTPDSQYVIFQKVPGGLFRQSIAGGPSEPLGVRPGNVRQFSMNADGRRLALDITRARAGIVVWREAKR